MTLLKVKLSAFLRLNHVEIGRFSHQGHREGGWEGIFVQKAERFSKKSDLT